MDFHHQLKGAILDAVDEGLIPRDPTRKAIIKGKQPRAKKIKYLNQFELHAMLGDLDLSGGPSWDWLILIVAKTGLRFSEALGLTPEDFDFAHQTLSVNKTWDYKNGGGFVPTKNASSVRKVQLDWQLIMQLSGLLKDLPPTEPMFAKGKSITRQLTAFWRATARMLACLSYPSTGCVIHMHHSCCSPASPSPAYPEARACKHDHHPGNLFARHSRAREQGH